MSVIFILFHGKLPVRILDRPQSVLNLEMLFDSEGCSAPSCTDGQTVVDPWRLDARDANPEVLTSQQLIADHS